MTTYKLRFLLISIIIAFSSHAQVGINTDYPEASSILDITSTDKGVLFPRMDLGDLTDASPVSDPVTGLMVWNTDAANAGVNKGFYYWDAAWMPLCNATGSTTTTPLTGATTFGGLTMTNDYNLNLNRYTAVTINQPSTGSSSQDIVLNQGSLFSITPKVSGMYSVSFTVTYEKNIPGGANTIEFGVHRNTNAISGATTRVPLTETQNTITYTNILNLDAYQYYGIRITNSMEAPDDVPMTIYANQTSFSIEKI